LANTVVIQLVLDGIVSSVHVRPSELEAAVVPVMAVQTKTPLPYATSAVHPLNGNVPVVHVTPSEEIAVLVEL
jgi:hypothetical protein